MKKTIFTFIIVCLYAISYGQTYTSLVNCGSDPLRYIEKNYQDNASAYIGKTIGFWADQSELQLNSCKYLCSNYSPYVANKNLLGKVDKIRLDVNYVEGTNDYIYYIYIYIDDSTPLNYKDAVNLYGDYEDYWDSKFYNFYKNAKIKKISIGKEINGVYRNEYRRPTTTIIPPIGEAE